MLEYDKGFAIPYENADNLGHALGLCAKLVNDMSESLPNHITFVNAPKMKIKWDGATKSTLVTLSATYC